MLIISDLHGCFSTLIKLLKKCPDEQIVFAGDLVDRGPKSKQVLEFAMNHKIPTVLGNHEDLMLSHYLRTGGYPDGAWLRNGGHSTLKSFGGEVSADVIKWVEELPLVLQFGGLLVSHTGHGLSLDPDKALWSRDWRFPADGNFRVFGHTPQRHPALLPNGICIDTGAAYSHGGYGLLTALQWPQMRVFQQRFDEPVL